MKSGEDVIRKDGKYLVLKRSSQKKYAPNKTHPFGGKMEIGENPYDGAIREIKEEELLQADLYPSVKSVICHIVNPNDGTVFTTNKYGGFESQMEEISKHVCIVK